MASGSKAVVYPWSVTPDKIDAVIQEIVRVSNPRKIILFGSAIHGELHRDSDLDILVVTRDPTPSPRQESVRIRRALRHSLMPMDILVVPESRLRELGSRPGLIYHEAFQSGRLVYDSE